MSTGFIDASVFYPDIPEGASVPEQIGIVGFDGLGLPLSGERRLTTVAQDF